MISQQMLKITLNLITDNGEDAMLYTSCNNWCESEYSIPCAFL